MLHPGLKIMPFKLTSYCRLRSKDSQEEECKCMALQRQMESSQQRQTRAGHFSS